MQLLYEGDPHFLSYYSIVFPHSLMGSATVGQALVGDSVISVRPTTMETLKWSACVSLPLCQN